MQTLVPIVLLIFSSALFEFQRLGLAFRASLGETLEANAGELPVLAGTSHAALAASAGRAAKAVGANFAGLPYRALPELFPDWGTSHLGDPVKALWIEPMQRVTAGERFSIPNGYRAYVGESTARFIEDVARDVIAHVGTQGVSDISADSPGVAAQTSRAAAMALFASTEELPFHDSFEMALHRALESGVASLGTGASLDGLAQRLKAIRRQHEQLDYALWEVAEAFGTDPEHLYLDGPNAALAQVRAAADGGDLEAALEAPHAALFGTHEVFMPQMRWPDGFEANALTAQLPHRGSPLWREWVEGARRGLRQDGYVLIPTRLSFSVSELLERQQAAHALRLSEQGSYAHFRSAKSARGFDVPRRGIAHYAVVAVEKAEAALTKWQQEFLSDVVGRPDVEVLAGERRFEFYELADRPLIVARDERGASRPGFHTDGVDIGTSIVWADHAGDGASTVLYPDLVAPPRPPDFSGRSDINIVPTGSRAVRAPHGDLAIFFGEGARTKRALQEQFRVAPQAHGSPAQPARRAWHGGAFEIVEPAR